MDVEPKVDPVTVAGIALLLMPLLTMAHEVGGHAATCLVTGGRLDAVGAFYVQCHAPDLSTRRLVALAGIGVDCGLGALVYLTWRNHLRGDLARLIGWYVWLSLLFSAAGYFLFSGISGVGDLGPGRHGGIGPLPLPALWRAGFALSGGLAYCWLIQQGKFTLTAMIGQGPATRSARRIVAHGFYAALCTSAVLASLPNPVGVVVTLASAAAASFGGKAGLISIGYATATAGEPRTFMVARSWLLFTLGAGASALFALVLGPTLVFPAR